MDISDLNSSRDALAAAQSAVKTNLAQQASLAQQIKSLQTQLTSLTAAVSQAQTNFDASIESFRTSQVSVVDSSIVTDLRNQLAASGAVSKLS